MGVAISSKCLRAGLSAFKDEKNLLWQLLTPEVRSAASALRSVCVVCAGVCVEAGRGCVIRPRRQEQEGSATGRMGRRRMERIRKKYESVQSRRSDTSGKEIDVCVISTGTKVRCDESVKAFICTRSGRLF